MTLKETLNKSLSVTVRQGYPECVSGLNTTNQYITVYPELVEGLNQR